MENTVNMSMEDYMDSLANDIEQIKAHPQNGCCDGVEAEVLENVLGIMNKHFGDYDTFCSENKAMAEFLTLLGYPQEQISDIANGGNPKTEIQLLKEEVSEMEKQPMANADAIARFKRKIESLQNVTIPKNVIAEIETRSRQNALMDIYANLPDRETEALWEAIMRGDGFDHEDIVLCEKYENEPHEEICEALEVLFCGYKRHALDAISLFKQAIKPIQTENRISLYRTSVQELSKDVIAMLDGEADYIYTGLGQGSMIFDLDTLKNTLSSCEEDSGIERGEYRSNFIYCEFNSLIEKVAMNGCSGLILRAL